MQTFSWNDVCHVVRKWRKQIFLKIPSIKIPTLSRVFQSPFPNFRLVFRTLGFLSYTCTDFISIFLPSCTESELARSLPNVEVSPIIFLDLDEIRKRHVEPSNTYSRSRFEIILNWITGFNMIQTMTERKTELLLVAEAAGTSIVSTVP